MIPPVTAHMMIPNGTKPDGRIDFVNHTPDRIDSCSALSLDPAWKATGRLRQDVTFAPFESQKYQYPTAAVRIHGRQSALPYDIDDGGE